MGRFFLLFKPAAKPNLRRRSSRSARRFPSSSSRLRNQRRVWGPELPLEFRNSAKKTLFCLGELGQTGLESEAPLLPENPGGVLSVVD